jgi:effector-binding domain-containing protein
MPEAIARPIVLNESPVILGRLFRGDYANSPLFIKEIIKALNNAYIPFIPNKILGVYFDHPQQKKVEDLLSFQGAFIPGEVEVIPFSLERFYLVGNYLYVKVIGEPMNSITQAYEVLFQYVRENNVQLKSQAGHQVSTFENGVISTEVYMQVV